MNGLERSRYARCAGAAAAVMLAGCAAHASFVAPSTVRQGPGIAPPPHGSKTFYYSNGEQEFVVPSGVTEITINAVGARGASNFFGTRSGWPAGRTVATVPVTAGETLAIFVGGKGEGTYGGFNGGGDGAGCCSQLGYGGGGASDVREGGDALSDRVVVAGGSGGGSQNYDAGGAGGGLKAGSGQPGAGGIGAGGGGRGGTQTRGGKGGAGGQNQYRSGSAGTNGSLGVGGNGGAPAGSLGYSVSGGGGGGGGYYGGGGGGGGASAGSSDGWSGGGGGGGSSYVEPTAIRFHMWRGWNLNNNANNGVVVLHW